MRIYIENLIPVFTEYERFVTVFIAPFANGEKRNLRCMNCGKLICQYEGEVASIVDGGDKPDNKSAIEVLCTRCRVMYRIVS